MPVASLWIGGSCSTTSRTFRRSSTEGHAHHQLRTRLPSAGDEHRGRGARSPGLVRSYSTKPAPPSLRFVVAVGRNQGGSTSLMRPQSQRTHNAALNFGRYSPLSSYTPEDLTSHVIGWFPRYSEGCDLRRTELGTRARDKTGQPPVSDWPIDSRGGTRTRDPGIMSAVL